MWIVKDGKRYGLLPPVCGARWSKMAKSMICCHQFVLDCQRWEEGRFVATSLCSIVKDWSSVQDGKKYDLLHVRFVATSLRSSIVKDRKKYDLLPPVCAQRWEEVRFVATSLWCSIVKDGRKYDLSPPVCASVNDGKKYDLLPPAGGARLSKMGKSMICWHQFVLKDGKKYDLLPPVCARVSKTGRRTICSHQFVLDCQRWEEIHLLPPACGARLSKM